MADASPALLRRSAGAAPPRRAGSLRRTTSIDVTWPEGRGRPGHFDGRARDVQTAAGGGAPRVLAQDSFEAQLTQAREIVALSTSRAIPALAEAVGVRAGNGLRILLRKIVPEELARATPLYLILDDLSGASLVSGWAWSQWDPDWIEGLRNAASETELGQAFADRAGICVGFAPGSSALQPDTDRGGGTPTEELANPADPEGWHAMPKASGMSFRRARRIDLWEDDAVRIEAAFQDSATTPAGGRSVVHEYIVRLSADPATLAVEELVALPQVLPFAECPAAAANLAGLRGESLGRLREAVLEQLRGTAGCTHLNDALRALADAPALLERLRQARTPA